MPILLFALSIIFAMIVARLKKIPLLSAYWVFLAFQALYNITPWLLFTLDIRSSLFALLSDLKIINIQLLLAATANICLALTHLFFYRRVRLLPPEVAASDARRRNFVLLTFPLFLLTCVLCEKYGWHQLTFADINAGGANLAGGMFTVTAYLKYSCVAVYLYYLFRFGIDKWAWVLLAEHVVVMLIDGSRTTFLPIALLTLFILNDKLTDRKPLRRLYLAAVIGVVLAIAARAVIIKNSSILVKMTVPVTVEGTMGAYSSLQSIYAAEHHQDAKYTYGASYLVDPLTWFLPTGHLRDSLSFLQKWVTDISNSLGNTFSPMGGFYYLSEAVAAFYFFGPAIVTTIFGLALVWVERHKDRYRLLYITWMPTIGLLFVKTIFGDVVKMFIIESVLVVGIIVASRLRTVIAVTSRQEIPG